MTLSPDEVAYMRAAQAESRPVAVVLQRYKTGRGPGGAVQVVPDGPPMALTVRITDAPDDIPQALADRLENAQAAKVSLAVGVDVRPGDTFTSEARVYEAVSDGVDDVWATAQIVWVRLVSRTPRT